MFSLSCLEFLGVLLSKPIKAAKYLHPPPPQKKRSTTCAYFGTVRSRYHILVAKGREIIKVVKDLGIIFLYSYMKALFRR